EGWAHEHGVTTADPATYLAEYDQLTLARLIIAQHRARGNRADREPADRDRADPDAAGIQPALALLDRIVDAARSADRGGSLVEARLVRALAHHAADRTDAALSDLCAALADGVPAGYVRLFLD